MIRPSVCENKIKELKRDLETIGNSESQIEYKKVLKRQIEGWQKEYEKSLKNNIPDIDPDSHFYRQPREDKRRYQAKGWQWI